MRPIDADELSDRILYLLQSGVPSQDIRRGIKKVYTMLSDTSTIEAEPVKHGRWDVHDVVKILASGKTLDGFCQCENCGIIKPYHYSEYDFCPNCGARMDGGD